MDDKTVTLSSSTRSGAHRPEDEFEHEEPIQEIENDQQTDEHTYDDLPEPSVLSSPRSTTSVVADESERSEKVSSQQQAHEEASDEVAADSLESLDWVELQEKFAQRMEEKCQEEQDILEEMQCLTRYYAVWAQTAELQEQQRAAKRLRTRIAFVQHKEEELENKRNHYANVVGAFENALQLLRKG